MIVMDEFQHEEERLWPEARTACNAWYAALEVFLYAVRLNQ